MGNVVGEQGLALQKHFHINLLILLKLQTVIKSHLLMMGASHFGHFDILDMLFPFLSFVKL